MMDFITAPAIVSIVTWGIYKLFELFVRKKERLTIIEKANFEQTGEQSIDLNISDGGGGKFFSLKFGCLFVGIGLGLLVGFMISTFSYPVELTWDTRSIIYGASVLVFGGIGLIASFIIERSISLKDRRK